MMRTMGKIIALSLALLGLLTSAQAVDEPPVVISDDFRFVEQDGRGLYVAICQGCHMAQGQGARGAALYPALAANNKLAAAAYVPYTVINGRKGMPAFGRMLSDEQITAVSNYVRSQFGNDYRDMLTLADVQALRPTRPSSPPRP